MRAFRVTPPLFLALVFACFCCLDFGAQSSKGPLPTNALGLGGVQATPLGRDSDGQDATSLAQTAQVSRIVVKLRAPFAAKIEAVLPRSLVLSSGTAANPEVADFLARTSGRTLAPLYPAMVRAKRQRQLSAEQLTAEVRQRFSGRARRLSAPFRPPDLSRTYVLELQDGSANIQQILNLLRADPNVEYAEPDTLFSINFIPNDPYFSSYGSWGQAYDDLWGIKKIGASVAWDATSGAGITVAVVDTGLDYSHPDISSNVWTNTMEIAGNGIDDDGNGYIDDIHGWNFVTNTNDPLDDHGHGTHVSGTIAAVGNNGIGVIGVAWQAKIMPVKALDSAGSGYESNLANAIVYAANNGADVISNSWGGPGSSQTIADAVSYAYNLGAVVVAAAGNSGDDARNYSPANLADVITVAATTPTDTLATFSNFGPKIDVAAPGVDILSLRASGTAMGTPVGTGYTRASGTSMATPHVSGAAALVLSQHPVYSNEQVRQALRVSGTDLGAAGYDLSFGYGGLNAAAAIAVTHPLEAKIQNVQYGSGPLSLITISGIARGTGFASYTLEYGAGTTPTSWTLFQTSVTPSSGLLGQFDPALVADGTYTIRLTAYNSGGGAFIDRAQLSVNTLAILSPVPSPYPTSSTTFKPGRLIPILGTAVAAGFQNFQVQWASGWNPSSGWQAAGITLAGGGLTPLVNAQLATWDTSSITQAGYYSIRVAVTGNQSNQVRTTVYLEPDLLSVNWPVWLDQGPYFNSGVVPASNVDGTLRLAVASPNFGTIPGALWILGPDGSSQKTPLPGYGSFHQPSSTDLDSTPGQELVLADWDLVHVFPQTGAPSTFVPAIEVDLMKHPLVVEDLDNDSRFETIAIGNNYANETAEIFAWGPSGQLVNSNYPIQIADQNSLSSWYNHVRLLVGDFEGDGKKEIVAQEGLSSTTYTLRIFASDGTPRTWNVPVLTGLPFAMVAADLDHNGKLETILFSYSGTQGALHVFQPDGSERPGWPVLLPDQHQYSQVFLAVGDLDRDGHEEIVVSRELDMYLLKANGTLFSSSWPLHTRRMGFGAVVLGDIDGDGRAEIVTTRNDVVANTYFDDKLLAIRSDGSIARSWQLTGMNGYDLYAYPLPAIGDIDQNGITDISVAYEVTGRGGGIPGVVTVLNTGTAFNPAANDWPMLLHDARNTGVLRRPLASAVTLTSSVNPSVAGQPVSLSVLVASVTPSGQDPTGTVNLLEGTSSIGSCVLSSGQCTLLTSALSVGSHSIGANYVGDAAFASSSAALLQLVNKAGSLVNLNSSPNPSVVGQTVTLNASVSAVAPGAGTPAGMLTFYDGTASVGTGTLDADGQLSLTTSSLVLGNHSLSAAYSGDGNFASAVSATTSQVVNAADFSLSGSSAQTVHAGASASYTLAVTPNPSPYNFAVTSFACSGLPAATACTFTPASVTPGAIATSVSLSISTTARSTAEMHPTEPPQKTSLPLWLSMGLTSVVGCFAVSKRRRIRAQLFSLMLIACALWTSCGGGGSPAPPPPVSGTPPGTYSIVVTAIGNGATSHTTNISLKVN